MNNQAGKGSRYRKVDKRKFDNNYNRIFNNKKPTLKNNRKKYVVDNTEININDSFYYIDINTTTALGHNKQKTFLDIITIMPI